MFAPLKYLSTLAAAVALAACAIPPTNMDGYRALDEADGLPVLNADVFKGVQPARSMYAEMSVREDYVRYDKDGARAEIYYISPRHGFQRHIALNHRYDSSDVATLFNYLNAHKFATTPGERYRNDLTEFWYRIGTLAGGDRQCVVFNAEWDLHHDDPLIRPDKVMFGYFCPKPGVSVDKALAGKIIGGLGVRDVNVHFTGNSLEVTGPAAPADQTQLAQLAQGAGQQRDWGSAAFPFDMAIYYSPSGGRDWND